MSEAWVVVVEHNLVQAIERCAMPPEAIPATPLEVSSQLARNNRENGCLDGRYYFADSQPAKVFASLCLEFTRALADKRIAAIEALPVGEAAFRGDEREPGGEPASAG
ncbi:MAG TPA: hypothetical protein VEC19_19810 [Usitatibacter sp.]|nr:hypothetical protein [Usitatibacter sp.]